MNVQAPPEHLPPGSGNWTDRLWEAQSKGWLTREEAWQVLIDAREAPDPALVVETVLRGLAAAYRPPPGPPPEVDPVVIMDLPEASTEIEPTVIEDLPEA